MNTPAIDKILASTSELVHTTVSAASRPPHLLRTFLV